MQYNNIASNSMYNSSIRHVQRLVQQKNALFELHAIHLGQMLYDCLGISIFL